MSSPLFVLKITILSIISLLVVFGDGLSCFNGYKLLKSSSVGDTTEDCEGSMAYCYNFTANRDNGFINVMKAGCSTYRCLLARDRCISTEFQGVPVQFCCCNEDRCNSNNDESTN